MEINLVKEPVAEAVVEVRFPGDARIEHWRGQYQQTVRREYPKMYVPRHVPGTTAAPTLQHYRFYNETETRFVAVALNSLAFGTTQYPGWQKFRDEFLKHWEVLKRELQPSILTRIGLSYTNIFRTETDEQTAQSKDALANVRFERQYLKTLEARPTFHQSVTSFQRAKHQMVIQLQLINDDTELQLNFDFSTTNVKPDGVLDVIEELHTALEDEFFGSITEDLGQALKPV